MSSNSPPRPQIPPGHGGPVKTPHANDVLSGRGGRINSHSGNVRFRELVDSLKREYLDPRTKKIEKARIAASIISNIRSLEPSGRFLKEDPHTGLWLEIGDERAWKKSGQALRESAPEIRAERQAQLQMMVGHASGAGLGAGISTGVDNVVVGGKKKAGRKSRGGADPPGPRHRPNPPEREGLATNIVRSNFGVDMIGRNQLDEDVELNRMRQEYLQMQKLQQLQQRRMEQYAHMLEEANGQGNYSRDNVYDEYNEMLRQHQMQQQMMMRQQDVAAATIMDDGLLPMDAGFDIPSLREQQQNSSIQQLQQQTHQDRDSSNYQSCEQGKDSQVEEAFDRQFNSCDKTVSTMSSFDIQSMDMSSLGGFSFNQSGYQSNSNYNMSLISTGSAMSRGGGASRKSALERKLEKVNDAHRREVSRKQGLSQNRPKKQGPPIQHDPNYQPPVAANGVKSISVPTHRPSTNRRKQTAQEVYNSSNMNMASLSSFGFEAIEEDDITEAASYKMSNLGLGLSEMDMTFSSDILSIRSKSVPKMRDSSEEGDKKPTTTNQKNGKPKRRSSTDDGRLQPSSDGPSKNPIDMDEFNESFKSMEFSGSPSARAPVDPDGHNSADNASPRRSNKDPSGGRLPTIQSTRATNPSSSGHHTSGSRLPRQDHHESDKMGISDPDMLLSSNADFGVSFNSIKSFKSQASDASSWLNQYNTMEKVAATGEERRWDAEGEDSSGKSSLSEIPSPHMVHT
mmetsp:Transcript_12732/g.29256  ORF Transcript_12732/g.29256 Transcript_12732/m.29256 type:complete len:738 (+) Transcript_12732:246-2459(+)